MKLPYPIHDLSQRFWGQIFFAGWLSLVLLLKRYQFAALREGVNFRGFLAYCRSHCHMFLNFMKCNRSSSLELILVGRCQVCFPQSVIFFAKCSLRLQYWREKLQLNSLYGLLGWNGLLYKSKV